MNEGEQQTMTKISGWMLALFIAVILLFSIIGCQKKDDDDWINWYTFERQIDTVGLQGYEALIEHEGGLVPENHEPVAVMMKRDVMGMKMEYVVGGKKKYATVILHFKDGEFKSVEVE